jgi:hypothetical protein
MRELGERLLLCCACAVLCCACAVLVLCCDAGKGGVGNECVVWMLRDGTLTTLAVHGLYHIYKRTELQFSRATGLTSLLHCINR